MTADRRDALWRAGLVVGLGVVVAQLVCGHGVPLLRHDWGIPNVRSALGPAIATMYEPWLLRGMGAPQPYPTDYMIGFLLEPMTWLPPLVFTWSLVAAIVALVAAGGLAIGGTLDSGRLAQAGCGLFAVLNPWTYTEIVSGHIFMIMAYGLLLMLCAETLRPEPRKPALVLWCALLICQIEFFAFAAIPVGIWLVRSRNYLALGALVIAALPIVFGMATHYQEIRGTPFLLEWQRSQSLDVLDAVRLRGYFAGYDGGYTLIASLLWVFAAGAVVATIVAVRNRSRAITVLSLGWVAAAIATGTKWVLAPVYSFVVLNFSEAGLFRELYDLIAFVAIAYVVSIALLARSHRAVAVVSFALSGILAYPWLTAPPETWFVPAALVPTRSFPGSESERLALFPPIQPLSLDGKFGSGLDPDMFRQQGRAVPINDAFPRYPEASALALAGRGDFSQLDALGVRYIVSRPYLGRDWHALENEVLAAARRYRVASQARAGYPMLGTLPGSPALVSVARDAGADGIFFAEPSTAGHTSGRAWFEPLIAPRLSMRPSEGWIDARLTVDRYPELATGFGGAFTTSGRSLPIPEAGWILAWAHGLMSSNAGIPITGHSGRLAWVRLPSGTTSIHCLGACIAVGVGGNPPARMEGPKIRPLDVDSRTLMPWLLIATIPAHMGETLRFATRYESSWTLLGSDAGHVRLSGDLNAWLLPAGPDRTIVLINLAAAIQFALELVAFFGIAGVICFVLVSGGGTRPENGQKTRRFSSKA